MEGATWNGLEEASKNWQWTPVDSQQGHGTLTQSYNCKKLSLPTAWISVGAISSQNPQVRVQLEFTLISVCRKLTEPRAGKWGHEVEGHCFMLLTLLIMIFPLATEYSHVHHNLLRPSLLTNSVAWSLFVIRYCCKKYLHTHSSFP